MDNGAGWRWSIVTARIPPIRTSPARTATSRWARAIPRGRPVGRAVRLLLIARRRSLRYRVSLGGDRRGRQSLGTMRRLLPVRQAGPLTAGTLTDEADLTAGGRRLLGRATDQVTATKARVNTLWPPISPED